jgi:hypothetical protein
MIYIWKSRGKIPRYTQELLIQSDYFRAKIKNILKGKEIKENSRIVKVRPYIYNFKTLWMNGRAEKLNITISTTMAATNPL